MKLIITEEEKSRILGMHQNATSRQYLNEDGAGEIVDGTISVPYNTDKNGKPVLALNQNVKVTIINEKTTKNKKGWLTEMGYDSLGDIVFKTINLGVPLRGIQKDSNGNLTGMFAITASKTDLINYLTNMNGKNIPNYSVDIELKGNGTMKAYPMMGEKTKFTTYDPFAQQKP